jgi:hypothetical protein
MSSDREFTVHLTNGETVRPDICKGRENGWLYCCWTGENIQRSYAPHAVDHYESQPIGEAEP